MFKQWQEMPHFFIFCNVLLHLVNHLFYSPGTRPIQVNTGGCLGSIHFTLGPCETLLLVLEKVALSKFVLLKLCNKYVAYRDSIIFLHFFNHCVSGIYVSEIRVMQGVGVIPSWHFCGHFSYKLNTNFTIKVRPTEKCLSIIFQIKSTLNF